MPSYADINGGAQPVTPGSGAISAAYYSTDAESASARTPLRHGAPTARAAPSVQTSRVTGRMPPNVKYDAVANKDTVVVLSTLPTKLQPMLARFDISGGELTARNAPGGTCVLRNQTHESVFLEESACIFTCISQCLLSPESEITEK